MKKKLLLIPLICITLLVGCGNSVQPESQNQETNQAGNLPTPPSFGEDSSMVENNTNSATITTDESYIYVHYINVGQAHSTLIQSDDFTMLIDSGNYEDGEDVVDYIESMGIEYLDIVIGTHPHEDHIGSMDVIFDNIDVGTYYEPYVAEQYSQTAAFYKYVNESIVKNNIKKVNPKTKDVIFQDDDTKVQILYDGNLGTDDYNTYSICTKVTFEDTSFIIDGDATTDVEEQILSNFTADELKTDVFLVAHHGSSTSNSEAYLKTLSPQYGIISCAKENMYGHPHAEVLSRLNKLSIKYLTTFENGTIIVESDGKNINVIPGITGLTPLGDEGYGGILKYPDTFKKVTYTKENAQTNENTSKEESLSPSTQTITSSETQSSNSSTEVSEIKYIGNKNTKTVHKDSCSSLPAEKNRVYFDSMDEALSEGYTPCKNCNP